MTDEDIPKANTFNGRLFPEPFAESKAGMDVIVTPFATALLGEGIIKDGELSLVIWDITVCEISYELWNILRVRYIFQFALFSLTRYVPFQIPGLFRPVHFDMLDPSE